MSESDLIRVYQKEIAKLREQFLKEVDLSNDESVRRWFLSHPDLKMSDHVAIAQIAWAKLHKIKKRAGLVKSRDVKKPTYEKLKPPKEWPDADWLRKAYHTHPIHEVAEAVGLSTWGVYYYIRKFKIRGDIKLSHNPCCNRQWIYKYYIEEGRTQEECAQLAGVNRRTFGKWMSRCGIPTRGCKDQNTKVVLLWVRKLLYQLDKHDNIILNTKHREDQVHVRFKDYLWETWHINKPNFRQVNFKNFAINEYMMSNKMEPPKVVNVYEDDMNGNNNHPAHIVISQDAWRKASFFEQRLALHDFVAKISQRGWLWPSHPEGILYHELLKLQSKDLSHYIKKNRYIPNQPGQIGFKLIEHFFDLSALWAVISRPKRVMVSLNAYGAKPRTIISTSTALRATISYMADRKKDMYREMPVIRSPERYMAMFKYLGIKGRMLDLTPNQGARAVACAMNGIVYATEHSLEMQTAVKRGLCDFTGLKYEEFDNGIYDFVFMDNDFRDCDISYALSFARNARKIVVFVPRYRKKQMMEKYKPKSIIPVNTHKSTIGFLFLW